MSHIKNYLIIGEMNPKIKPIREYEKNTLAEKKNRNKNKNASNEKNIG
jgi:hypothetical protein